MLLKLTTVMLHSSHAPGHLTHPPCFQNSRVSLISRTCGWVGWFAHFGREKVQKQQKKQRSVRETNGRTEKEQKTSWKQSICGFYPRFGRWSRRYFSKSVASLISRTGSSHALRGFFLCFTHLTRVRWVKHHCTVPVFWFPHRCDTAPVPQNHSLGCSNSTFSDTNWSLIIL